MNFPIGLIALRIRCWYEYYLTYNAHSQIGKVVYEADLFLKHHMHIRQLMDFKVGCNLVPTAYWVLNIMNVMWEPSRLGFD
jgi:hypothetical protein